MTSQHTLPPRGGTSFADQPHAYDPVKEPRPFQSVIRKRVLAFIVDAIIITVLTAVAYAWLGYAGRSAAAALKELVDAGNLGQKTGRGFYTYPRE